VLRESAEAGKLPDSQALDDALGDLKPLDEVKLIEDE